MNAFVFALLFTAAGMGAAVLALRVAGDLPVVRWLGYGFLLIALVNLLGFVWDFVAADPGGAGRVAVVVGVGVAAVLGYLKVLRALRRQAAARRDGR